MCSSCFEKEIDVFYSLKDFEIFEIELSHKLSISPSSGLVFLAIIHEEPDLTYKTYLCHDCNTEWYLFEPYSVYAGFFQKKENAVKTLYNYKDRARMRFRGCLLKMFFNLIILLIAVLYFIFS